MRRPVYPCSFVSHSHAPCPINGFYQQSGAQLILAPARPPALSLFLLSLLFSFLLFFSFFLFSSPHALGLIMGLPRDGVPPAVLRRAPRFVFCDLRFLLHYVCPALCLYMAVITPHWRRALSVERSFLRAIPQIFFTSFTAPLPSPPRGIFFRRVSAPRVPVLLVTFYPLVRL